MRKTSLSLSFFFLETNSQRLKSDRDLQQSEAGRPGGNGGRAATETGRGRAATVERGRELAAAGGIRRGRRAAVAANKKDGGGQGEMAGGCCKTVSNLALIPC
jgi:hypothetical protein